MPWVLTALLRAVLPGGGAGRQHGDELYALALSVGIGLASVITLAVVWSTWVMVPPGQRREAEEPSPWTHKVGLTLAVAWPLQCGFGLVVLGAPS